MGVAGGGGRSYGAAFGWATSPGGVGGAVGQRKRKRSGLADEGLAKRGVRELERAEAGRSARLRSGLTYDLYIHTQRLRVFVLLVRIRVGALPRTSPVACGVAMAERALIHVHVHTCIVYTVRDGNEMACGSCWSAPSYMYGTISSTCTCRIPGITRRPDVPS